MEITYFGHSAFKLKGKTSTVVTDPFGDKIGKFPRDVEANIVTVSHDHFDHNESGAIKGSPFVITGPGEYEVGGVSVVGVASYHDDKQGADRGANTIYVVEMEGLRMVHLGDLGHKLDDKQLEEMGSIDIVFVPVGGEYTIDAKVASEVVRQIDPWVVVPMHYQSDSMTNLAPVSDFLKEISKPEVTAVPKLVITADKLPSELQVVVLDRR